MYRFESVYYSLCRREAYAKLTFRERKLLETLDKLMANRAIRKAHKRIKAA
jgi:hypothetical protein